MDTRNATAFWRPDRPGRHRGARWSSLGRAALRHPRILAPDICHASDEAEGLETEGLEAQSYEAQGPEAQGPEAWGYQGRSAPTRVVADRDRPGTGCDVISAFIDGSPGVSRRRFFGSRRLEQGPPRSLRWSDTACGVRHPRRSQVSWTRVSSPQDASVSGAGDAFFLGRHAAKCGQRGEPGFVGGRRWRTTPAVSIGLAACRRRSRTTTLGLELPPMTQVGWR